MRAREIAAMAKQIGKECLANSCEGQRYGGFVMCYSEKGAQIALSRVSHLLPNEPLDPLTEAAEDICEAHGLAVDSRAGQAVIEAIRRGHHIAAASVDTLPKGQDAKQGLAGTEGSAVPNEDSADAQPSPQSLSNGDE